MNERPHVGDAGLALMLLASFAVAARRIDGERPRFTQRHYDN